MAYGFCGFSLRETAAWASVAGVAHVSDVALLKRFRAAGDWMNELLGVFLQQRLGVPEPSLSNFTAVRLIDATAVSKPGSRGTDWRLHMGFDLRAQRIRSLELTGGVGGESFRRLTPQPGELLIADRGYARASGLRWVMSHKANFLVRVPWNNVPLETARGASVDVIEWLRALPEATPVELNVRLRGGSAPLRLIALRKSEPAAEASRRKILQRATNHTKGTDPRTLEAAGYVLLLTNVEGKCLSTVQVVEAYRFRWQIELCFKTLKSVLSFDVLPAKDPHLARTILAAKLLGALLIEEFSQKYLSFSPWGYPLSLASPVSMAAP